MSDIAHQVNISGKYSLEFEPSGLHSIVSIRFWKGRQLVHNPTSAVPPRQQSCRRAIGCNRTNFLVPVGATPIGQCVWLPIRASSHTRAVRSTSERDSVSIHVRCILIAQTYASEVGKRLRRKQLLLSTPIPDKKISFHSQRHELL